MEKPKIINADDKSVKAVLAQKFNIDFFQREFNWKKEHVEQLLIDLEGKFKANYSEAHERRSVANYSRYYLGPIILSERKGMMSVIDGQQRLTTLTLLLIYLRHLVKENADMAAKITPLIYSESYGEKSYNLQIKEREICMDGLYKKEEYNSEGKGESVKNIVERYNDIEELFPADLKSKALPYFIDWLINNVIFVEIITYSNEDAYTIFETMNDRGLNLTPTQMLKGYLLSLVQDDEEKKELNELWKEKIFQLHKIHENEDLEFFRAWLRAKYAESIRPGKKGAANKDFEIIANRFHSWVRNNKKKLNLQNSQSVSKFIKSYLDFYVKVYLKINKAVMNVIPKLESIYYISERGLAFSLYLPLLLSPINFGDDEPTIKKKLALVSYYLELFVVLRSINRRNYSHSSIRYTMCNLVKEIRNMDIDILAKTLKKKASEFEETFEGMDYLILHGQNKRFIHFLLARITNYIEEMSGMPSTFIQYYDSKIKKPFEIEHIWADKFEEHRNEFEQRDEFEEFRNNIGALLLVQRGFNQSYGDLPYKKKLPHYLEQNLLARSLHSQCYERNPSFKSFIEKSNLPFKAHEEFKKEDIIKRQKLYKKICERIWNLDNFDKFGEK